MSTHLVWITWRVLHKPLTGSARPNYTDMAIRIDEPSHRDAVSTVTSLRDAPVDALLRYGHDPITATGIHIGMQPRVGCAECKRARTARARPEEIR